LILLWQAEEPGSRIETCPAEPHTDCRHHPGHTLHHQPCSRSMVPLYC